MTRRLNVVSAVIVRDERALAAMRGPRESITNMWEFSGEKIEHGESPHEALASEITKKLLVDIRVGHEIPTKITIMRSGLGP